MNRNPRIGMYYLAGTFLFIIASFRLPVLSPFLLWTALSTGVLASGYFFWGAGVYRKRKGQIPLLQNVLMAPVRLGQWLSLLYYRRKANPKDEIIPNLFIGGNLTGKEERKLIDEGVTSVLDLTAEFSESPALRELCYQDIPVLDLTAPSPIQLSQGVTFIHTQLEAGQKVYVHCKAGYSRSAAMVGAYLIKTGIALNVQEAVTVMKNKRPSMVIRPEIQKVLENYSEEINSSHSDLP